MDITCSGPFPIFNQDEEALLVTDIHAAKLSALLQNLLWTLGSGKREAVKLVCLGTITL